MDVRLAPQAFPTFLKKKSALFCLYLIATLSVALCAYFSVHLTREYGRIAAIWPANAVLLAFVLRGPPQYWKQILFSGFLGYVLAFVAFDDVWPIIIGFSLCNTLQCVFLVLMLRRFIGPVFDIRQYKHLLFFGVLSCTLAPALPAGLASLILHEVNGASMWNTFSIWFIADALGLLIVTPLAMVLNRRELSTLFDSKHAVETMGIFTVLLVVLAIVFLQRAYPLLFVPIAVLVLASFRLSLAGATLSVMITVIVAITSVIHNEGPLSLIQGTLTERVLVSQLFLLVAIMVTLPVASVVSARKALQESLLNAKLEAEKANLAKSEFLTSMSHELRTPLNAILGFGQLLLMNREKTLGEREKEYVDFIIQGGNYLQKLIGDILDLAKIESGKLTIDKEIVSCAEIVRSVVATLQPMAAARRIQINQHTIDPALAIHVDQRRLMQVLINLGSNAIKYNRAGGYVDITVEHTAQKVRFSVADNGFGIAYDRQPNVFQPFNRLGAEKGAIEGTGIGLAIARRLVESMNGVIGFDSIPDKGSTFWVEMPRVADLKASVQDKKTEEFEKQTGSHAKILYIEDNAANVSLMTRMAQDFLDAEMFSVDTGKQGLDKARLLKPDLIITDIHLPDMSGYDLLKKFKDDPQTAHIPIIALTADAMSQNYEQAKKAGFDEFFTKPFDISDVLKTIQEHIKRP